MLCRCTLFRTSYSELTFRRFAEPRYVETYIEMHVVQNIKSHDLRFWCVLPAYSSLYWKCRTNLMTGKLPESLTIIIIIKQQVTQQFMALFWQLVSETHSNHNVTLNSTVKYLIDAFVSDTQFTVLSNILLFIWNSIFQCVDTQFCQKYLLVCLHTNIN